MRKWGGRARVLERISVMNVPGINLRRFASGRRIRAEFCSAPVVMQAERGWQVNEKRTVLWTDPCDVWIYRRTKEQNIEWGGFIVMRNGKYTFTSSVAGHENFVGTSLPGNDNVVGLYHSHTDTPFLASLFSVDSNYFSGTKESSPHPDITNDLEISDVYTADNIMLPMYLLAPSGEVKCYTPTNVSKSGTVTIIGTVYDNK